MSRLARLAAAASLAGALIHATPRAALGWPQVGLRGGLSVARLQGTFPASFENEWLKGFMGGADGVFPLRGRLALQIGILFVPKGSSLGKSTATDNSGNLLGTFETLHVADYLEVPVLARLGFGGRRRWAPYVVLGPALSFELSERLKNTGADDTRIDVDYLKNFDLGIASGLGLDLAVGPGAWTLEARHVRGVSDLDRGRYGFSNVRTAAFELTTGYAYGSPRP